MRRVSIALTVLLGALALLAGAAAAAPQLSDAKVEPPTVQPLQHVTLSVAVQDPAKEVGTVEAVVVEYPEFMVVLNDRGEGDDKQAGDGVWSAGTEVPAEALAGTYHIAFWPRDANGRAFKVDDQYLKLTTTVTVGAPGPTAPAAPKLSEAAIQPAVAQTGDHVVVTVKVEDPGKQVARVEAVVTEYPVMTLPLNDEGKQDDKAAGDGIWTLAIDIPEAPAGTYHLEISPRDASGQAFEVDGAPVKATVALEIKAAEVGVELSTEELRAAAAPWRTEAQIAKIKALGRRAGEPFRFVVMGDTRTNPQVFAALLKLAAGLPQFDFSINTGDIVPGGQPHEYAFFFNQIQDVTWPFLIVEGNHELGPSGGRLYEELFGPTDYYFDHGGVRFVGLNNAKGVVTPQQLQWLREALNTNLRKVVFFHAPPAVIKEWAFHAFSAGAEELTDLLAQSKVERVYVGHIHGFDVADCKGVRYVLSGGGGAPLYEQIAPGNFHHILLVEVLPDGLRETVYRLDGASFVLDAQKWLSGAGQ